MEIVDIVMLIAIVLSILIFCLTVFPRRALKLYDAGIKEIAKRLRNNWLRYSIACIIIYFWCILFSILCTLLVLHLSCFSVQITSGIRARIIIYSILSIFTTICPYVIDLKKISKVYREAFRGLDQALIKDGDLEDAISRGEEIINKVL